jgi:hypothetical protein
MRKVPAEWLVFLPNDTKISSPEIARVGPWPRNLETFKIIEISDLVGVHGKQS